MSQTVCVFVQWSKMRGWCLPGRLQSRSDVWGSSWSSSVSCCSWMNPGESAHPWYEGSRVPDRCWETQKSPSQSQSWHRSTSKPAGKKYIMQLNLFIKDAVCRTCRLQQTEYQYQHIYLYKYFPTIYMYMIILQMCPRPQLSQCCLVWWTMFHISHMTKYICVEL